MNQLGLSEKMNRLISSFREAPWTDSRFYRSWLAQSYFYTTHSTRMLAYAAGWSTPDDQGYYRRSLHHIKEEQSHDLLAVRDLEALGARLPDYAEMEVTRAMWETQFAKIQRHPSTLLGYIMALEELAVRTFPLLCKNLASQYGEKATRFVKVHADDDPDHVSQAMEQIGKRTDAERQEILRNYDQTCVMYGLMIEGIMRVM